MNEWWKKKFVYRDRYGLVLVMSNFDLINIKNLYNLVSLWYNFRIRGIK